MPGLVLDCASRFSPSSQWSRPATIVRTHRRSSCPLVAGGVAARRLEARLVDPVDGLGVREALVLKLLDESGAGERRVVEVIVRLFSGLFRPSPH